MPTRQTADYDPMMDELPPDLAAEYMAERRRRKISEAMLGQSQMPLVAPEVKGRFQGAISPFQGLAKIAQAYMANKGLEGSEGRIADIGKRNAGMQAEAVSQYKKNTIGTPDVPMGPPTEEGAMGVSPGFTPTPEQRQAAIADAMIANNPRLNKMGALDFARDTKKEDRIQASQDKLDQIEAAAREGRITRDEAAIARASAEKIARAENAANREAQIRIAASLRPAPQPVAPTMKDIVDPKDPTRMISVDARTYRGGSVGDAGVLGIAGKEPTYAKRQDKEGQGVDLLRNEIDNMKMLYSDLADKGGTPSTANSSISNAGSWLSSTGVGQLGGRIFGTDEQKIRNEISAGKRRILSAIKNATGASAQEMNSNVELKTWMDSLGDPTQSYESNINILDALESSYVKGKKVGGKSAGGKIGGNPHSGKTDAQIKAELGIGG